MNSKTVSQGSHAIIVPNSASEVNELQFQTSESNFALGDGNLITATLKLPADSMKTLTRVGLCYTLENEGAVEHCVGIGGGNILSMLEEFRIYINGGQMVSEICGKHQINSTIKEQLLTLHGSTSVERDTHHRSEFGQSVFDPLTGCFNYACLGAAGSGSEKQMIHMYLDRLIELGKLPLKSINEIKLEFKVDQSGYFVKALDPTTALADVKVKNFEVWGTVRKNLGSPAKTLFSNHTVARPRFHHLRIPPAQASTLQTANQKLTVNLTSSFSRTHLVQKINVYGVDLADPMRANCRIPVMCGVPDLKIDGNNNQCGAGSGASVSAGKKGNNMHRYNAQVLWYNSRDVEVNLPYGDPNLNKGWSLDGFIVAHNEGDFIGPNAILAQGMTLGEHTHELEISNGDCVLNATTELVVEIQYLELERLTSGGQVVKVQAV